MFGRRLTYPAKVYKSTYPMVQTPHHQPPTYLVFLAFATVYVVWGSTYFFIQKAIQGFPPFYMGALRFWVAGLILLGWSAWVGDTLFNWNQLKPSVISGILLLFVGNGTVIWAEQYLPSALVAILISSSPIWFVVLDKGNWRVNFNNKSTISGLLVGFAGVIILFYENITDAFSSSGTSVQMAGMALVVLGTMAWAGGSLYSKYYATSSARVNSAWQMMAAALVFTIVSLIRQEPSQFNLALVPAGAWLAVVYLIVFGSVAAYSAYVWLLQVRPATQVSTYAYVNPVVAVLLGVFLANEKITLIQVGGLIIILLSVLLINLNKYRQERALRLQNN